MFFLSSHCVAAHCSHSKKKNLHQDDTESDIKALQTAFARTLEKCTILVSFVSSEFTAYKPGRLFIAKFRSSPSQHPTLLQR